MAKRNSKNKKIRLAAIAAALSTGGIVIALLPSANADQSDQWAPQPTAKTANADAGNRHFIHIATHGAPSWDARAWLYDGKGTEVYSWKELNKFGNYVQWEFTDGNDGGSITVEIDAVRKLTETFDLDRDQCFLVDAGGFPKYTGDSVTGGCTSE